MGGALVPWRDDAAVVAGVAMLERTLTAALALADALEAIAPPSLLFAAAAPSRTLRPPPYAPSEAEISYASGRYCGSGPREGRRPCTLEWTVETRFLVLTTPHNFYTLHADRDLQRTALQGHRSLCNLDVHKVAARQRQPQPQLVLSRSQVLELLQ